MKRIKAIIWAAALATAVVALGAEAFRVELSAEPAEFPADSATLVSITLNRNDLKGDLSLPKLPGVVWHTDRVGVSESRRFVNGRGEYSMTYTLPLSAEKPGELTIPPLEFTLKDGRTARSNSLKLKVLPPGSRPSAAADGGVGAPEGSLAVPPGSRRSEYYTGEEIPLELALSIPARTRVRNVDYPKLAVDGPAVFPDYSKLGRSRHPHFSTPREGVRGTPHGRMRVVVFDTFLRFMKPGEFRVTASESLEVAVPSAGRRGGDDDFFGGGFFGSFFEREATRPVTVRYPELKLKVLPLPPPPVGAHFLNLVGDWRIKTEISARVVKVGEPVELRVALSGVGGDGLIPPVLELPGFRVYPPEVKNDPATGKSICYALIPLQPGEHTIAPRFAVFDPAAKRYRVTGKEFKLAVSGNGSVGAVAPGPPAAAPPIPAEEKAEREELFYQKPDAGKAVAIPLAYNAGWAVAALAALAFAALALEIAARRREDRDASPELAGRAARRAAAKRLCRQLKAGGDAASLLRDGGMELLAAAVKLPAGSTAGEVAEKIQDPELAKFLRDLEQSSFAPVPERELRLPAAARRRLGRLLKRAVLWLLPPVLFAATLHGGEAYNSEFDRGNYAAAMRKYAGSAVVSGKSVRPGAWYNAGCAAFKAGDAPRARLYLERAHLLAPRDSETVENLNLVNRTLRQPEIGRSDTPRALLVSCRDCMRPDGHAAWALVCGGLALLFLALRRRIGYWPTAVAVFMTLLALTALCSQLTGPYRSSRAVVTAKELELRALPVAGKTRVEARIPGGGDATVLETRGDWVRLLVNGRDGWTERSGVETVFPYGFW